MSVKLTRREALKLFGSAAVGLALTGCAGADIKDLAERKKITWKKEYTTICPFCGVGCGLIVVREDTGANAAVKSVEGDPDHPINRGSLCSKGSALYQLHYDVKTGKVNRNRLQAVQYRAPGAKSWTKISWDKAFKMIAKRFKAAREKTFVDVEKGTKLTVNRTEGVANLGGASLDNEECYLLSKLARALGIVYLEHQARI
jgi:formate dehydrogenase major subunit